MVMRITGMASGFDTEGTITKLMKAQRIPLDKLVQKKQLLEWQRDDYRALNLKILDFRSVASDMKLPSKYQSKKASSADEAAVSVTASATASEGIYKIKVVQLAEAASINSGVLGGGAGSDSKKLSDIGLTANATFTITGEKGSSTIQLKPGDTLGQFVANINGESNVTGVKANYDSTLDRVFFVTSSIGAVSNINLKMQSTTQGASQNLLNTVFKLSGGAPVAAKGQTIVGSKSFATAGTVIDNTLSAAKQLKITVNGSATPYKYDITKTTTVSQLIDSINSDLGKKENISAYLDASGKLALFNPDNSKTIALQDDASGTLLTSLGWDGTSSVIPNIDYSELNVTGKNASISFNGLPAVSYNTNNFSIGGMNFTAKNVTANDVNITVSKDVDTVYNTIKSFVDKYNELIDTVNKKVEEKRNRDFQPLTDEQKKTMKDDDIKRWEEKAKSGMLHSDQMLASGMNSIRISMSGVVQGLPAGQLKSLSEIGISTSVVSGTTISGNYLEKGKLYIDDTKLKAAIGKNPEEVASLFLANDNDPNSNAGDGIAVRMYDQANQLFSKITNKAGLQTTVQDKYLIGKSLKDIDKQVDGLSKRMDAVETRYYKQFTAMETYINKMNAQSSYLSQQFK